ncbi:monoamine oxidase protein [Candidatus Micropelagos thuwalensis]|uniref:Monoamine oxidase protein n=1 Tax=Candidatus Micropelagius thuwalensis TaxID=1397666 RepID=U2XVU2_9PROT|nr:ADP-ribosylglycohydrolase family protein [Candidatus Micropelagos thuwalensis]ERL46936.1 monoamine oxidase protein [Candidatus Micropelagos thuwalensis]
MKLLNNSQIGCMLGLAVGDALGAPVEFNERDSFEPISEMEAGGYFDLPAGAWTDDTAMSLALFHSLKVNEGLDRKHLLQEFCEWMENGKYSSTGKSVGIGQNTFWTLNEFRRSGVLEAASQNNKSDGNGSLMRLAPVPVLFSNDKPKALKIAIEQSFTTHSSNVAAEACAFACNIIVDLINGKTWDSAIDATPNDMQFLQDIPSGGWRNKSRDKISSSGYVIHTLEAALWCVNQTGSFDEAVLLAVNLGDDADTVGAVTGQFAGALYGYDSINKDWLDLLKLNQYPFNMLH